MMDGCVIETVIYALWQLKWRLAAQRVDDKGEKIKQAFTFSHNISILPKKHAGDIAACVYQGWT